ncbi:hypothetical protein [Edaphobacillus lindanitolerans]|uniref:Ribosomal protein L7/L12 C-terminal domain-containing protein n=1 Tax=Edaphobacillus lindanitolerans TaxID=550447 RepID=A0A1U7PSZ0_9BACI|nr:hypothetical protein [Edaphobacillus lindanitolerans]SIT91183.1 hypothetical protein SAMN05428946_2617 [Edaphobacillus lindanitolerans]
MGLPLFASLIINIGLLFIVFGQSKRIKTLREENKRTLPYEKDQELIKLVREKINTVGDIKTVKFLRETTGMSMIDAKQFVDEMKNQ